MGLVGPLETCKRCGAQVRKGAMAEHVAATHRLRLLPPSERQAAAKKPTKSRGRPQKRNPDDIDKTGHWW